MTSVGFPNILQAALFDRTITTTRSDLAIASQELATGVRNDFSQALAGRAGEYNLVTKAIADIESTETRLSLVNGRFETSVNAIKGIRNQIDGFAASAAAGLRSGGVTEVQEVISSAENKLTAVLSTLNSSHAGRRLFAGDEVGGAAVADADSVLASVRAAIGTATDPADVSQAITDYFQPGAGFDTDVYLGGAGEAGTITLPSGLSVDNSLKADDPAFRDIIEGLVRLTFTPDDATDAYISEATSALSRGETNVVTREAEVGRQQNLIDQALASNQEELLVLRASEDTLVGVDAFEAATRVQLLEVQLQAAFTVSARLSDLHFANFIR